MISRNLPESRKKDKNNKVSIDGLKKSRAGKSSSVFHKKRDFAFGGSGYAELPFLGAHSGDDGESDQCL